MMGYSEGKMLAYERRDKYTERIINDRKVPAKGHRVKRADFVPA